MTIKTIILTACLLFALTTCHHPINPDDCAKGPDYWICVRR